MSAQANMHFTNPIISQVLEGNYNPADYAPTQTWDTPEDLALALHARVLEDSLKSYLLHMVRFETRNTGSDTLSESRGMGAARSWVLSKFDDFAGEVDGRLLTGFFQFDQDVCGMGRHKNVVALLPGSDPTADLIIIEAHLDSRCASVCDVDCEAQGMEDNGSGSALVMELARAMSPFSYRNSILFVATTGEEQGLVGANALAQYCVDNSIAIKLVQNNDIVGGIICGETSSAPSCPGLNHVDSTQVRLFSRGNFNAAGKGLARYIKHQYEEMLKPLEAVPMQLTIMSAEDRAGRGGDHIPFRERGFAAMRFTSANEHGNADSSDPDYHDRQHTSEDVLGVDTDLDGQLDSFFVDFNYLGRNARINAVSASMAAIAPDPPMITEYYFDGDNFFLRLASPSEDSKYVIGVRTDFNDFDSLYYLEGADFATFQTAEKELSIFISAATVDSQGVESLWSEEVLAILSGAEDPTLEEEKPFKLMSNRPNPFDEATTLSFWAARDMPGKTAYISIADAAGREIERLPVAIRQGVNEVLYRHGYGQSGMLIQTLIIDGQLVDSKPMIFAN